MTGPLGALIQALNPRVPYAPAAPTVSSPTGNQDTVVWVAPNNGGSPITLYYWESDDGKSGTTTGDTSAVVSQEGGTTQSYRVRAQNAIGIGDWSAYSTVVTTTFSFAPTFGFTPAPCVPNGTLSYVCGPCTPCRGCLNQSDSCCSLYDSCGAFAGCECT
jgi:hypothetical protein